MGHSTDGTGTRYRFIGNGDMDEVLSLQVAVYFAFMMEEQNTLRN